MGTLCARQTTVYVSQKGISGGADAYSPRSRSTRRRMRSRASDCMSTSWRAVGLLVAHQRDKLADLQAERVLHVAVRAARGNQIIAHE